MASLRTLASLPRILVVNWIGVPILAIALWAKLSFLWMVLFVIGWLVADKIWDSVSTALLRGAGGRASIADVSRLAVDQEVPSGMAFMMLCDVLVTLAIPWLLAAYFLDWIP